jgi:hypothetical protein
MHKRPVIETASVRMSLGHRLGLGVATFRHFRAVSATEKLATIIDSIEFCTACHAKGRGFEPVAPCISINDLARAGYSDCNVLAAESCNSFGLDGGALAATGREVDRCDWRAARKPVLAAAAPDARGDESLYKRLDIREREHGRVSPR